MTEFDSPVVTLYGWQDVKIQLLSVPHSLYIHIIHITVLPIFWERMCDSVILFYFIFISVAETETVFACYAWVIYAESI